MGCNFGDYPQKRQSNIDRPNCTFHIFFRITQETEWAWQRKLLESGAPKIDRENVEDELDRGDCLTIGTEEKFENENEEGGMYFY